MLTDKYPFTERRANLGGTQRIYSCGDWSLSCINGAWAHSYPFAWEIAIAHGDCLCYITPLTDNVEIFDTDDEANAFIDKAMAYFAANPKGPSHD